MFTLHATTQLNNMNLHDTECFKVMQHDHTCVFEAGLRVGIVGNLKPIQMVDSIQINLFLTIYWFPSWNFLPLQHSELSLGRMN
jgi:hypothetical protein